MRENEIDAGGHHMDRHGDGPRAEEVGKDEIHGDFGRGGDEPDDRTPGNRHPTAPRPQPAGERPERMPRPANERPSGRNARVPVRRGRSAAPSSEGQKRDNRRRPGAGRSRRGERWFAVSKQWPYRTAASPAAPFTTCAAPKADREAASGALEEISVRDMSKSNLRRHGRWSNPENRHEPPRPVRPAFDPSGR
jgi:hypothetical protein